MMAVFVMNFTQSKGAAKANIKYIQHRPGGKTERNHLTHCCALAEISNPEQLWYFKTGSPSHLGNAARLMLGDILLKMQGRCVLSVQEDDRDGKVPVSAFTRRDGHWPG